MGWSEYNRKKHLAKDIFFKLKESFGLVFLQDLARCQNQVIDLILEELDKEDKKKSDSKSIKAS